MPVQQLVNDHPPSADVTCSIEAAIVSSLGGQVIQLRVVATPEGLVLQGRCRTQHARQLVLHAVQRTGLPIVTNEICVAATTAEEVSTPRTEPC